MIIFRKFKYVNLLNSSKRNKNNRRRVQSTRYRVQVTSYKLQIEETMISGEYCRGACSEELS